MASHKNNIAINHPGTETEKKYNLLHKLIALYDRKNTLDEALQEACEIIPTLYDQPELVSVYLDYDNHIYKNKNFIETAWISRKKFNTPDKKQGILEIYYVKEYNQILDIEETSDTFDFLADITTILSGIISKFQFEKLMLDNTERLKELKGIRRTTEILSRGMTLEESLQEICSFLPEAWQYPEYTAAKITYDNKVFKSKKFKETPWVQEQVFETPDNKEGIISIYYLKEFPPADEGPFLKEERDLIDNLSALISGTVTKKSLQELLLSNTERLKELRGINQTSHILKQSKSLEESLQVVCMILPEAWQFPEHTAVRIHYNNNIYTSSNFKETPWSQKQEFETPGHKKGLIEIFYLKKFPKADEGPFLQEERNLLINLANLISGTATRDVLGKLLYENRERLKELKAINQTTDIIAQGKPIEETLQEICNMLPKSWQYPKFTVAKISFEDNVYTSTKLEETPWVQKENFITIDNKKGTVEIFYTKEFKTEYEGPFLKEERNLLVNIAKLISGYINNYKGREIYRKKVLLDTYKHQPEEFRKSLIENKKPLQLFFNKQIIDKYIYLDMMKYKVKEILFVATLYDAFILENEDRFFEQFMGEIYQYSLFSLPRITGVNSAEEALKLLEKAHFDLVILMVGIDRKLPETLSNQIKQKNPDTPIYLLLNQKSFLNYFVDLVHRKQSIEKLFVWNGDSQIFFAIVKSIEDKANVENDTKIGLVRVILLVEDSPYYYSKYLQMLYSIVFSQVQQLLPEVEKNELDKICKMRSRPKILLAKNYEDAVYIFNKYKDYLLCVISDIEFERDGKPDKLAGLKLIRYIKSHILNLPIILQSSEAKYEKRAQDLNVSFMNKNSETLIKDLREFLNYFLGFGDFIFRDREGNQIAVAKSLSEFEKLLHEIPDESFFLHAQENQFSIWLMARGEIQLAKTLNPIKMSDFKNISEARKFFMNIIREYKQEKKKGKIVTFNDAPVLDEKNIATFSSGSLGGKGRGLAFINTLINNLDFTKYTKRINIRTPLTAIIGTDEFEKFIEKNKLFEVALNKKNNYQQIKQAFVDARLSSDLVKKIENFAHQIHNPIAVRSSSLSEDSLTQPFAGVFDTYIIPNVPNQKINTVIQLITVIKLVYASVFSDNVRTYFKAINHKMEEEKMAVVLQELVGTRYDNYYYPHISGIAQSYNFYPLAHMKPHEGFAVIAFGLGTYVVEGWKSFRFSPVYPKIEMYSQKDLLNNTQVQFFAVDCTKKEIDFIKDGEYAALELLDISKAEKHGTLKHCTSVYNIQNDRIEPGISSAGPRLVNFADILQYNYIPLSETINLMLSTFKEALGSPVEIEFAIDLNKTLNNLPSFYLLQIKPQISNPLNFDIDIDKLEKDKILLYTESSLGNGEIDHIEDVIYINTENFDKLKTLDMVREIEYLNNQMIKGNKQYILIGPGRWGTRDKFLGIPVNWSHISYAKVITEISLANFPLDSSLGSHFFHNITSMNVGYFSVLDSSRTEFIRWDILKKQERINQTTYFNHVRFKHPLRVLMNGGKKKSAILF